MPHGERTLPGRLRLPVGHYFITGRVYTEQPGRDRSLTSISYPELNLTTDNEITLDARTAHQVSVRTDQPDVRDGTWYSMAGTVRDPRTNEGFRVNYALRPRFSEFYAGSVPGVSSPSFVYADTYKLTTPTLELSTGATDVMSAWLTDPMPEGTRQLPLAYGLSSRCVM
ncbi:hypothetical protein ACFQ1S_27180 [Kibdelosporangium lantanae]|uniref:Uncharacterized protein n=1 Tax=Kibdelosporangium lantanae TaxID=1497396 RepID=A0ABW3MH97_9PSEU